LPPPTATASPTRQHHQGDGDGGRHRADADSGDPLAQRGEGGTLQNLLPTILANVHDVDVGDQARLDHFLHRPVEHGRLVYYDAAKGLLTYTADGYNPNKTTDSFTYTIADPHGLSVTGTVNVAIRRCGAVHLGRHHLRRLHDAVGFECPHRCARRQRLADHLRQQRRGVRRQRQRHRLSERQEQRHPHRGRHRHDQFRLHRHRQYDRARAGRSDTINGASLTNGTKLDLRTLLAQCDINLAGDLTKVSQYFSVANNWGNLSLQYNQASGGCGGSATVAVLNGMNGCTSLATLISSNMLQV